MSRSLAGYRHSRFALRAVTAGVLCAFLGVGSGAAQAPAPATGRAPAWPQAASDIPADPAVRFGALPNGMRYTLMKNATPPGQVSIRLRIGAGSLEEADAQQGLAHFLEHMAFRGSTHVADGEVFRTLQRLGLRAGADANASTSQTQTQYQVDLPNADAQLIDTGLMLMREVASELLLKPEPFEAERGPVLSEERLRDGPGTRAFEAQEKFLLKGQLAPLRFPIGKIDVIQHAPVSLVADFYHDYYRPERTSLIVVGDTDLDALEAKIKEKFSDWRGSGQGRADPDLGAPAKRGEESLVFSEAGAPRSVSVSWIAPYDGAPDTAAKRKRDRFEGLGFQILNQRLARVAESPDAPFLSAGGSRGNTVKSAKIASFRVNYGGDNWQKALEEADKIRRQVLAQGVTQEEVDREIASALASGQASVAASSTRTSPALAGGLVASIDRESVFNSPQEGLARSESDFKGLTAETVTAALRNAFQGSGPLLFLSSPTPVANGEQTLASVFDRAESAPIANAELQKLGDWPYTNFGAPGKVADTRRIEDLDTTLVRFENGVRLTVKPTKYRADQVLVTVSIAGGRLTLPKDRVTFNTGALVGGGLEAMNFFDLRRELATKIYGVGFGIDDDTFSLSGGTRPADLDTQLQVLAAYLTKPGWRPEAFQQGLTATTNALAQRDSTATSVFGAKLAALLRSGDVRWAAVESDDVAKAKLEDLRSVIAPALANGPIEITMVGDITVDQAVKSVAATFGALPARSGAPMPQPKMGDLKFPAPNAEPVKLTHNGRADQSVAFIGWPTTDAFADSESAARRLVTDIIQTRLMEQLREKDGATYSPQATAQASLTFPGFGYIAAISELPPQKQQLFYDTVASIVTDLGEHGPNADELERARKPEIDGLTRAMVTNGFWQGSLTGIQTDERRLKLIRHALPQLKTVAASDVQRVAQKYLTDARAFKIVVLPKN